MEEYDRAKKFESGYSPAVAHYLEPFTKEGWPKGANPENARDPLHCGQCREDDGGNGKGGAAAANGLTPLRSCPLALSAGRTSPAPASLITARTWQAAAIRSAICCPAAPRGEMIASPSPRLFITRSPNVYADLRGRATG